MSKLLSLMTDVLLYLQSFAGGGGNTWAGKAEIRKADILAAGEACTFICILTYFRLYRENTS